MKKNGKSQKLFHTGNPVIAMVHVSALPGTPKHTDSMRNIIEKAVSEACGYGKAGADAVMIENMHDIPYLNRSAGPEITASMTAIGCALRAAVNIPIGIQILAGANREALAAAAAAKLDFIRAEGFVFAHVADEGIIESCAGELLRYRKAIGAEHILVFADIKKKHSSHAVTADVSIAETAKAAEFFLADGVIVTGTATGVEADPREAEESSKAVSIPVFIGSGITEKNFQKYLPVSNGFIVGTYFKKNGDWTAPVDFEKVKRFMDAVKSKRLV